MFTCERCGSRYSAMHAATMQDCPRCKIRDRVAAPLAFKAFHLPEREISRLERAELRPPSPAKEQARL